MTCPDCGYPDHAEVDDCTESCICASTECNDCGGYIEAGEVWKHVCINQEGET